MRLNEPNLQPTLEGTTLTLRPLVTNDLEALYQAASDPQIWTLHPAADRYQQPVFELFFEDAMRSGGALAVMDQNTGKMVGSSRYYDWDAQNQEIAIGYTFLARSHWGGAFNAEMKKLMLDHAFTFAKRVWFHVGPQNWRSRRAMEKIGGVFSHQALKETRGRLVDYVFYKMERP